jgi:hypothetical protein
MRKPQYCGDFKGQSARSYAEIFGGVERFTFLEIE